MNWLKKAPDEAEVVELRQRSLEEMLQMLRNLGDVALFFHRPGKSGWTCSVTLNHSVPGAEYKVKSGFGHETPTLAVAECLGRAKYALEKQE